ncbi:TonB-dependent siderophore receptor [Geminocystis herdmanii]|uniref:TonB-dependent siderophore receptor n=1 Tax=Geminocystis herdmanii TaxID=669359 RepID=UPI00034CAF93|nr:TonB-dependent siderophore receptor [Geminocystis herdmanii]
MKKIRQNLSLTVLTLGFLCPSVLAQESQIIEQNIINNSPAETAQVNIIEITNIKVIPTEEGINLLLQTNQQLSSPEISITENALIADIPNVVLNLATGEEFLLSNPVEGIPLINVVNLPDNRVRVTITGTNAPPIVDIQTSPLETILTAKQGTSTAQTESSIEIIATGEAPQENNYFVPSATSATRTDTLILDTPQSIQVVPQQILRDQQVIRVDEALRNVSGVIGNLNPFGVASRLTIRGFTTDNFTGGAVFRDGFRINNNFGSQETANVERIEVLKGPSSVLYGQNDPGGIINLVTKRPLADPFLEAKFQLGSYGLVRPQFDLNVPLTEDKSLLSRLNFAYQNGKTFRDFDTDTKKIFIAPVLTANIGEKTKFSVLMEYLDEDYSFDLGLVAQGNKIVSVPRERIINEPNDVATNESITVGYDFEHRFNDDWRLNHGFRYMGQSYNVNTVLPFNFDEKTGDLLRFFAQRNYRADDYSVNTSVLGKFETGNVKHELLTGVDLNFNRLDDQGTKIDISKPTPINIFNPIYGLVRRPDLTNVPIFPPFNTEYDQVGVFLQDQISFGEQFILLASLRYDDVTFRNTAQNTSQSNNNWSPRIGVVYKPIETVSIYGNYSQSFKPNLGQTANGDTLEPERAEGFEFGVKAEFLEGKLLATLAYFDISKRNVATSDPDNAFFSVTTGEQRSNGIEFDIVGEILPGWNIIANYAYTNARVTNDNTIPIGNRLFNAPYNSAGLWTTYQIQEGDLEGLGLGLGFNYVGDRAGDLANSFEIDSYFVTNMAIFYEKNDWRVGLNFNNIFNAEYISSTNNSRLFGNSPGQPFSVIGAFSVKF